MTLLAAELERLSISGPTLSCSLNLKSKVPPCRTATSHQLDFFRKRDGYFAYESERRDVAKRQKKPEPKGGPLASGPAARCVGMLPYHSDQIEKVGMPQAADIPSMARDI